MLLETVNPPDDVAAADVAEDFDDESQAALGGNSSRASSLVLCSTELSVTMLSS